MGTVALAKLGRPFPGNNPLFRGTGTALGLLRDLAPQENIGKGTKGQVERNEAVAMMQRGLREFLVDMEHMSGIYVYWATVRKFKDRSYSASDIELFSKLLVDFQDHPKFEMAGMFLSALVFACKEQNFVIHTTGLEVQLDSLGYENKKNVTIIGDAWKRAGYGMKRGKLIVKGNAGELAGLGMKGGLLEIMGNVRGHAGCMMEGGEIRIKGNAWYDLARDAEGGIIRVGGSIESVGILPEKSTEGYQPPSEGKVNVWQRGVQIVKDGEHVGETNQKRRLKSKNGGQSAGYES